MSALKVGVGSAIGAVVGGLLGGFVGTQTLGELPTHRRRVSKKTIKKRERERQERAYQYVERQIIGTVTGAAVGAFAFGAMGSRSEEKKRLVAAQGTVQGGGGAPLFLADPAGVFP